MPDLFMLFGIIIYYAFVNDRCCGVRHKSIMENNTMESVHV